jgi:hypothetical protein
MVATVTNDFNSEKARATRSLFFSASTALLAQAEKLANEGRTTEVLDLIDVFVNGRADPDNIVASHAALAVNDAHRASDLVEQAVVISKTVQANVLAAASQVLANPKRIQQLISEPNTARGIAIDPAQNDAVISMSEEAFERAILFRGAAILNEYTTVHMTEENAAEQLERFRDTIAIMKRTSDTIGSLYVLKATDMVDTGLSNSTRPPRTEEQTRAAWGSIQESDAEAGLNGVSMSPE